MNQIQTGTETMTTSKKRATARRFCATCGTIESEHSNEHAFEARARGFAAMNKERVREIASKGGISAHKMGTAHTFTAEEASAAGKKGGSAPHKSRGGIRKVKAPVP